MGGDTKNIISHQNCSDDSQVRIICRFAAQRAATTVGHTESYARGERSNGLDSGPRETTLGETGKRSTMVELQQTPVVGSPRLQAGEQSRPSSM